ncbi:uncharacterized protein TNCV_3638991 [Trichonephila clavipes]|nr:uncharacterized protein TNCV_3638991 [Trichonephila clavipes]
MENIMGSFYTREELPQYCYTLYSLWGQPNKKRERFPKGAIMRLHFFLNASLRSAPGEDEIFRPKHNIPSTPAVQIAVHSPYYLPSPYLDGANYLGGRAYEIRLTMGIILMDWAWDASNRSIPKSEYFSNGDIQIVKTISKITGTVVGNPGKGQPQTTTPTED